MNDSERRGVHQFVALKGLNVDLVLIFPVSYSLSTLLASSVSLRLIRLFCCHMIGSEFVCSEMFVT